jgi:acetyltransferase
MSQRGLEALLRPKSIAVIGASMKPQRAGYLMMRNLLAGGFNGPVCRSPPPGRRFRAYWHGLTIESLPFTPDLAVLCTNAGVISNCSKP